MDAKGRTLVMRRQPGRDRQRAVATVMSLLAAGTIDKAVAGELVHALQEATPADTATRPGRAEPSASAGPGAGAIAVIGVTAQLPGGASIGEFWDRLMAAENLITPLPRDDASCARLCSDRTPEPNT